MTVTTKVANPYQPRMTRPEAGNKYYITKSAGGYSSAIKGKPTDSKCNVLHNCVGYAYGRFNEIGGYGSCKYLSPVNAEKFMDYRGACTYGFTPKLGAVAVWQAGDKSTSSDGAGHVAIVEKIISPTEIITSESGYNAKKAFWTQTRKKGTDGNWGEKNKTFLGFIYNPAVVGDQVYTEGTITSSTPSTTSGTTSSSGVKKVTVTAVVVKKGVKHEAVKSVQALLNMKINAGLDIDGSCGAKTEEAIKKFQTQNNLTADGSCGAKTWQKLLGM